MNYGSFGAYPFAKGVPFGKGYPATKGYNSAYVVPTTTVATSPYGFPYAKPFGKGAFPYAKPFGKGVPYGKGFPATKGYSSAYVVPNATVATSPYPY